MTQLVTTLLSRGDHVSITKGRLSINPKSGIAIPANWLDAKADTLVREILTVFGQDAYRYDSYTTGLYGPHKSPGVTLQFVGLLTGESAYAIFNVNLNRARGEKKGTPLSSGQFRVGKRSLFYKFWDGSGLNMPPRLSSFHDYMGNLKPLIFIGQTSQARFDAKSIEPLSITHELIERSIHPDNIRTSPGQFSDNSQTTYPDKELAQGQIVKGVQRITSTCGTNQGNTVIRDTGTRESLHPIDKPVPPQDQTHEEWLAAYGDVGISGGHT